MHAGVLSALGMLVAPRTRHLSRSFTCPLATIDLVALDQLFNEMSGLGLTSLQEEGVAMQEANIQRRVDLRYQGQSYCLTLEWKDARDTLKAFHQAHENRYGHQLDQAVELVSVRVQVSGPTRVLQLQGGSDTAPPKRTERPVSLTPRAQAQLVGIKTPVPVYAREQLLPNVALQGPALITETVSTTFVAPAWQCKSDVQGNLLLNR